jgi:intraflagellar transport protein 88
LVKLTTEMGLSAKADQYQIMLRDVVARLQEIEQDGYGPQASEERVPKPNAMSGATMQAQAPFTKERVESPELKVGSAHDMVQTAVAGTGKDDIWDGVDLDLG